VASAERRAATGPLIATRIRPRQGVAEDSPAPLPGCEKVEDPRSGGCAPSELATG